MVLALIRLILQLKLHHRLFLEDFFLFLAVLCLIASTTLTFYYMEIMYLSQELIFNHDRFILLLEHDPSHADYIVDTFVNEGQPFYFACPALLWVSIFAVKFNYLAFFRRLIDRVKPLIIYWRFVVAVTIVSFPLCVLPLKVNRVKWGLDDSKSISTITIPWSNAET